MHKIFQLILIIIYCLFPIFSQPLCASEKSKILRVGIFQLPGALSLNPDGKIEGFIYEYLQHLLVYVDWEYKYVGYGSSWNELLDMLEKGDVDLLYCAQKNPDTEKRFLFSERACGYNACRIYMPVDDKTYFKKDYSQWGGIKIGIIAGSPMISDFADFALKNGFKYNLKTYKSFEQMHSGLHSKKIDAMIASNLREVKGGELVKGEFAPKPYFFMMRKNDKIRIKMLDEAMTQSSISEPALLPSLRNKYLTLNRNIKIPFSKREIEFIEKCNSSGKKFDAILCPTRIPLAYQKDGKNFGILNDIVVEIIKLSGLNIEIKYPTSISEYVKIKKNRNAKIIFDLLANPHIGEELGYFETSSYVSFSVSRIRTGGQDAEASIASIKNSPLFEQLIASEIVYRTERIRYYDSFEEIFKAVQDGKVRECYMYTRMLEHFINKNGSADLSFDLLHNVSIPFAIGIRKDDADSVILKGILEKCVSRLDANFVSQIFRKYSPTPEVKSGFADLQKIYFWESISIIVI